MQTILGRQLPFAEEAYLGLTYWANKKAFLDQQRNHEEDRDREYLEAFHAGGAEAFAKLKQHMDCQNDCQNALSGPELEDRQH